MSSSSSRSYSQYRSTSAYKYIGKAKSPLLYHLGQPTYLGKVHKMRLNIWPHICLLHQFSLNTAREETYFPHPGSVWCVTPHRLQSLMNTRVLGQTKQNHSICVLEDRLLLPVHQFFPFPSLGSYSTPPSTVLGDMLISPTSKWGCVMWADHSESFFPQAIVTNTGIGRWFRQGQSEPSLRFGLWIL